MFLGARKNSRGVWWSGHLIPVEVREFLELYRHPKHDIWITPLFFSLDSLREIGNFMKIQRSPSAHIVKGVIEVTVDPNRWLRDGEETLKEANS